MKLTKENYELMMFDLLEGNLSEQEEQLLLQEIESDPFFNQEWKLFSETILEPETMVFAGKDGLLKEEKAVIIPLKSRLHIFSYAAAVAAILARSCSGLSMFSTVSFPSFLSVCITGDFGVRFTNTSRGLYSSFSGA